MLNLNRATILGNATRDPELRTTPNGHPVASFAIATNRRYKSSAGEPVEEVQFHEIVAWGKLAEIVNQYIQKGSKVYVEGRIQTRNWEGQDGNKREKTEIVADNVINLSSRPSGSSSYTPSSGATSTDSKPASSKPKDTKEPAKDSEKDIDTDINLDDIPF